MLLLLFFQPLAISCLSIHVTMDDVFTINLNVMGTTHVAMVLIVRVRRFFL